MQEWKDWDSELQVLPQIALLRPYIVADVDQSYVCREGGIFCDLRASGQAYGSVAYLRRLDSNLKNYLSFFLACSKVPPKHALYAQSRPVYTSFGAQLSKLPEKEFTLRVKLTIFWTHYTTVLTWLQSPSYSFKVFVGLLIAEIQKFTKEPKLVICGFR